MKKGKSSMFLYFFCIFLWWYSPPKLWSCPWPTARRQPPSADGWSSHQAELLIFLFPFPTVYSILIFSRERLGQAWPSCSVSDKSGFLMGDKWRSRAQVVRVHGNNPGEALRGRRACQRSPVKKMKRDCVKLIEVPQHRWWWGVIRDGTWFGGAAQGMGTAKIKCVCVLCVRVSDTFKLALLH